MTPPTIQEMTAKANREIVETLIRTATAMPPDKLTWQPMEEGRDALDMLVECAEVNFRVAKVLELRATPPRDPEQQERTRRETDTLEKAVALLRASADALSAAILAFPDDHLSDSISLGRLTRTFGELMVFVHGHSNYHFGQISYIQTLYGDKETHF